MVFTNEPLTTTQTAVLAPNQAVVCEFYDKPPTGTPYFGKNLCEECIAELDDHNERLIGDAEAEEHYNDPEL